MSVAAHESLACSMLIRSHESSRQQNESKLRWPSGLWHVADESHARDPFWRYGRSGGCQFATGDSGRAVADLGQVIAASSPLKEMPHRRRAD